MPERLSIIQLVVLGEIVFEHYAPDHSDAQTLRSLSRRGLIRMKRTHVAFAPDYEATDAGKTAMEFKDG